MPSLEEVLGYRFHDKSLLRTALTHTSFANENRTESYERLEFLGDSVLGYITAEFLFSHVPMIPEGQMTKLRSSLVCEGALHLVAQRLGLGSFLLLGKGEEKSGGRERVSVLADVVEAVIAAMYLDGGIEPAKVFILEHVLSEAVVAETVRSTDFKTELQEYVQKDGAVKILYEEVSESGPDHKKEFVFRVLVNGTEYGQGTGRTKKEAEQHAAEAALGALKA